MPPTRSSPKARSRPWASRCCWASRRRRWPRIRSCRRLVPGDDEGAHRRRDRGQDRPLGRPQGERHHRQADPGGYGSVALPRSGPHLQGSSGFAGGGRDAARLRAGGSARYRGAAAPAAGIGRSTATGYLNMGTNYGSYYSGLSLGHRGPAAVRRGRAPVHLRRPGRVAALGQQVLRGGIETVADLVGHTERTCCASRASA